MFIDILTVRSAAGDGSVHSSPVEDDFSGEVSIVKAVINGAIGLSQLRHSELLEQIVPGAKEIRYVYRESFRSSIFRFPSDFYFLVIIMSANGMRSDLTEPTAVHPMAKCKAGLMYSGKPYFC